MSDNLKKQLIIDEGLRLFPYYDTVDKLTIGVGRNLTDVGITKEEAMCLLDNDITKVRTEIYQKLPWVATLNIERQNVLFNMAFNLGVPKLLEFKNTLYFIKLGYYETASKHMLNSKWARQVGDRAVRLAKIMRDGQ